MILGSLCYTENGIYPTKSNPVDGEGKGAFPLLSTICKGFKGPFIFWFVVGLQVSTRNAIHPPNIIGESKINPRKYFRNQSKNFSISRNDRSSGIRLRIYNSQSSSPVKFDELDVWEKQTFRSIKPCFRSFQKVVTEQFLLEYLVSKQNFQKVVTHENKNLEKSNSTKFLEIANIYVKFFKNFRNFERI